MKTTTQARAIAPFRIRSRYALRDGRDAVCGVATKVLPTYYETPRLPQYLAGMMSDGDVDAQVIDAEGLGWNPADFNIPCYMHESTPFYVEGMSFSLPALKIGGEPPVTDGEKEEIRSILPLVCKRYPPPEEYLQRLRSIARHSQLRTKALMEYHTWPHQDRILAYCQTSDSSKAEDVGIDRKTLDSNVRGFRNSIDQDLSKVDFDEYIVPYLLKMTS